MCLISTEKWILKFHKIISFKMKKKKDRLAIMKPCHRYFPCNFLRFWKVLLNGHFQSSLNSQSHFQSWHKVTNIFLFISKCLLCNYADDNTLYKSGKKLQEIKNDLEMDFMILHKWFHMVLNPDKCHYIVIGDDDPTHKIILNKNEIAKWRKTFTHLFGQ